MAKKEKQFKKTAGDISKRIVPLMGYCLASDRITVDGLKDVNTIAHYDNEIIPFLEARCDTAFGRNDNGVFEEEAFEPPLEDE